MNNDVNQIYAAPKTNLTDKMSMNADATMLSDELRYKLQSTRRWVLFIAAFGMIFSLIIMVITVFNIYIRSDMSGEDFSVSDTLLIGTALLYVFLSISIFLSSLYLFKYYYSIHSFLKLKTVSSLEKMLITQARYWKVVGFSAIGIFLIVLGVIIAGAIEPF